MVSDNSEKEVEKLLNLINKEFNNVFNINIPIEENSYTTITTGKLLENKIKIEINKLKELIKSE